jgi:hypothetical protein
MVVNHYDSAFNRHPNPARGCAESVNWNLKGAGFFEGMFRGDDHQKEQITGAHPLKPLTDGDPTCDPSLDGASEHRASPRCEYAEMGGGDDSIGKGSGCPRTFVQEVICGIPGTASL